MSKREHMHEILKADAICYDLPNEEIIQQLANENEQLESENKALREAVGLLNSMILSGENHSEQSKKVVEQALKGSE